MREDERREGSKGERERERERGGEGDLRPLDGVRDFLGVLF